MSAVNAGMVKLADTPDLGSGGAILAGSSPVTRTKQYKSEPKAYWRRVRICRLFRLSEFQSQERKTKLKNGGQENESEHR